MSAGRIIRERITLPHFSYVIDCYGPDGRLKWHEGPGNLVTDEGATYLIEKAFRGASYTPAWYLMLAGTGTKAVGNTLASHVAWAEVTPYTGTRPALTFGVAAARASVATLVAFSINATATVAGAAICNQASGTTGILYSVSDFAAPRGVGSGDTLNVTPTVSG